MMGSRRRQSQQVKFLYILYLSDILTQPVCQTHLAGHGIDRYLFGTFVG